MNTDTSHLIIAQSSSWSKNDAKDSWILLIFSAFVFDLTDRFFCGWIFTVCYLVGGLDCGHGDHHLFKWQLLTCSWGFSGGPSGKESTANAGDAGSIPGSVRSPGIKWQSAPQLSCLENSMGRGAWWATVRWVARSQTRLRDWACTGSWGSCE